MDPTLQSNPAMAQWQTRFDAALRASQEPRRQAENAQQFQQRQSMAMNILRQLQTSKPVPQAPPQGGPVGGGQMPQGQPQGGQSPMGGGMLGGLYGAIANAFHSGGQ